MKLWRCQFGEVMDGFDFREDPSGVCGRGIYAMKAGDRKLRKYYSARGENTFEFEVPDNLVKKIGGLGKTYYQAIREEVLIQHDNGFRVFICKHHGINIPTSKQIVITDASIITNVKKL